MLLTQPIDQPSGLTNSTKIINAKKEGFAAERQANALFPVYWRQF
jgi:hypothetical protein